MIGCTCSRCQDEWRVVRDPARPKSATEEPRVRLRGVKTSRSSSKDWPVLTAPEPVGEGAN